MEVHAPEPFNREERGLSVIYVASPYSHPDAKVREYRYERVRAFTASLLRRNLTPFSPIVYCHELAKDFSLPTDAESWKRFNDQMLSLSVAMVVLCLEGWQESLGVTHEIEEADRLNLSIFYYDSDFTQISYIERDLFNGPNYRHG